MLAVKTKIDHLEREKIPRWRFVFGMEAIHEFGNLIDVEAPNREQAWQALKNIFPDAIWHVKNFFPLTDNHLV